ncbi:MAG: glycosyltransferase family 4 protein [Acidobacteria bacterium]|nr:glycosyltransferase family 4 protein [Acidobacteriota bacterium]
MKRRVVILTEIIAPYRIPVFNALAARTEVDLHVIFLSETDPGLRKWQVYRDELQFSSQVLTSYRARLGRFSLLLTRGVVDALRAADPEIIVCGGYNYFAMWQAQRWARRRGIPFLLWSESNAVDERNNFRLVEAAKRRFIRACQGYVVPGESAAAYLKTFGLAADKIFLAPNAVDVARFVRGAEQARQDQGVRNRLGLPQRYLLYVGRFVRSKGVLDLLAAYATLPESTRREVGLVMAGDGEERDELVRRSRAIQPGTVLFPGFLQRDQLPAFYALSEALVLPTHSDPWGLVVNEALACGRPVIVTDVAGCVADLVQDGENGYVVPPGAPAKLAAAMMRMLSATELRVQMGDRSLQMSSQFTPEMWAHGVVRAVEGTLGENRG